MYYAVEMFPDDTLSEKIKGYWRRLKDEGISDYLFSTGSRPHISLCVLYDTDAPALSNQLSDFCRTYKRIPVCFSSVGIFTAPKPCVFLAPVVTAQLLDIHKSLWMRLNSPDCGGYEFYREGQWVPHCAVGISESKETAKRCAALLLDEYYPIEGYIKA